MRKISVTNRQKAEAFDVLAKLIYEDIILINSTDNGRRCVLEVNPEGVRALRITNLEYEKIMRLLN